jgi:hypothetical protein
MARHRRRLHGHRLLLFPVRHLLSALGRAVGLHRRGSCQIGLLPLFVSVFSLPGHRQCGRRHFCGGLHDSVRALARQWRHSPVHRYGRPALAHHRGQLRRPEASRARSVRLPWVSSSRWPA